MPDRNDGFPEPQDVMDERVAEVYEQAGEFQGPGDSVLHSPAAREVLAATTTRTTRSRSSH